MLESSHSLHNVGIGAIACVTGQGGLTTILGSCVGIALIDPALRFAALAHTLLPRQVDRGPHPAGRHVDTAVRALLRLARDHCGSLTRCQALLAGGANMFGRPVAADLAIGELNLAAARQHLAAAGITIQQEQVGGFHGRRMTVSAGRPGMQVEDLGGRLAA